MFEVNVGPETCRCDREYEKGDERQDLTSPCRGERGASDKQSDENEAQYNDYGERLILQQSNSF